MIFAGLFKCVNTAVCCAFDISTMPADRGQNNKTRWKPQTCILHIYVVLNLYFRCYLCTTCNKTTVQYRKTHRLKHMNKKGVGLLILRGKIQNLKIMLVGIP